jgi:uncharacterized protein (UPF0335 family)
MTKDVFKDRTISFVTRIENLQSQIAKITGNEINPIRGEISSIYNEAEEQGLDIKALKAAIKVRAIERKLSGETLHNYEDVCFALGDLVGTPLGDHAIDASVDGESKSGTKRTRRKQADAPEWVPSY